MLAQNNLYNSLSMGIDWAVLPESAMLLRKYRMKPEKTEKVLKHFTCMRNIQQRFFSKCKAGAISNAWASLERSQELASLRTAFSLHTLRLACTLWLICTISPEHVLLISSHFPAPRQCFVVLRRTPSGLAEKK